MANVICYNCEFEIPEGDEVFEDEDGSYCLGCRDAHSCVECGQVVLHEELKEYGDKGLVCSVCVEDSDDFWTGEKPSWMQDDPTFMDSYDPDVD